MFEQSKREYYNKKLDFEPRCLITDKQIKSTKIDICSIRRIIFKVYLQPEPILFNSQAYYSHSNRMCAYALNLT